MEQSAVTQLAKTADVTVKFFGDFALVPGASQVMSGKLGSGVGHAVAGVAGGAALGPIGWLAVAANSFTKSLTDQHIWGQVEEARAKATEKREFSAITQVLDDLNEARNKDEAARSDYDRELMKKFKSVECS